MNLDDLLTPQRWDPKRCQVEQALAEIEGAEDRAKVAAAAADPRVPQNNMVRAFKMLLDDSPGISAIQRHRGGGCRCKSDG